jgi:hypothetical protein
LNRRRLTRVLPTRPCDHASVKAIRSASSPPRLVAGYGDSDSIDQDGTRYQIKDGRIT